MTSQTRAAELALFPTPIGRCGIAWRGDTVIATRLPDTQPAATPRFFANQRRAKEGSPPETIQRAIIAITALLEGDRADLSLVACDFGSVDPFAEKVYTATRTLAPGETSTYGAIATEVGEKHQAREVGQALGRNPLQYAQKKQLNLDGIRILCATLWTDFEIGAGGALDAKHIATQMNDYKKIRVAERGYRKLRPSDVLARHRDHRRWLESALASPFDGRTLVATHHAPHPDVLGNYADDVSAAYASDLSDLIERYQPERWFFGHCHGNRGGVVGETQLLNVSLGYPEEVSDPAGRIQDLILDL